MTYRSFKEWFAAAQENNCTLARVVMENEMELGDVGIEEVYTRLAARWQVMRASVEKALEAPRADAGMVAGQASCQMKYSRAGGCSGEVINRLMARAFSASEVNASMGRICAAPTAGSCGVLPAVLLTAAEQQNASEQELLDALLVASGVGAVIIRNATVSGAEGGCQAECGAAAAMAAAAAVTLAGGDAGQVGHAVSIALMNCMGLVCDPVAGLVQIPCSYRNASQAVNAFLSADMALAGQNAVIPPDEAVEAMFRVGKQLPAELRETALGGVAITPTALEIQRRLME